MVNNHAHVTVTVTPAARGDTPHAPREADVQAVPDIEPASGSSSTPEEEAGAVRALLIELAQTQAAIRSSQAITQLPSLDAKERKLVAQLHRHGLDFHAAHPSRPSAARSRSAPRTVAPSAPEPSPSPRSRDIHGHSSVHVRGGVPRASHSQPELQPQSGRPSRGGSLAGTTPSG